MKRPSPFPFHDLPSIFRQLDQIGVLSAPALVADSLTATSLSLEWQIPLKLTEVTKGWAHIASYLVQWRYEEIGHDWKYCRNQSIYENSTIKVSDLRPFTKYRVSLRGKRITARLSMKNNFGFFSFLIAASFELHWSFPPITRWKCSPNRVW